MFTIVGLRLQRFLLIIWPDSENSLSDATLEAQTLCNLTVCRKFTLVGLPPGSNLVLRLTSQTQQEFELKI